MNALLQKLSPSGILEQAPVQDHLCPMAAGMARVQRKKCLGGFGPGWCYSPHTLVL